MPRQSMTQGKTTTDHDVIRRWVEARGGTPATVKRTARGGEAGILRIDYPGYSGKESLTPIEWDEFFEKFDENQLAFVYQDERAGGGESRFSKFIKRPENGAQETEESPRRRPRKVTARSAGKRASAKAGGSRTRATTGATTRKPAATRAGRNQKAAAAQPKKAGRGQGRAQGANTRPRKSR
jgi:hypothetical protein